MQLGTALSKPTRSPRSSAASWRAPRAPSGAVELRVDRRSTRRASPAHAPGLRPLLGGEGVEADAGHHGERQDPGRGEHEQASPQWGDGYGGPAVLHCRTLLPRSGARWLARNVASSKCITCNPSAPDPVTAGRERSRRRRSRARPCCRRRRPARGRLADLSRRRLAGPSRCRARRRIRSARRRDRLPAARP